MSISERFSQRAANLQVAAIRQVVARASGPDFIPLTAGKPAEHLFPFELTYQQTGNLIEKHGGAAFQYSPSIGLQPLRQWLADRVEPASADTTLIIAGSQQGIDLCGKLFVDPGDKIAFVAPTYPSALSTLRVYGPEMLSIECDQDGPIPESITAVFQQDPKLVYCIPNFSNPTGVYMTLERRKQLIALAQEYNVVIIEDDPYGQIRFEAEPLPSLYELAPEQVIYIGSFSKIIAPGFRLGWLMAPEPIFTKLVQTKQASDLQCGAYVQTLVYEMLATGFLDEQIVRVIDYYRGQRNVMIGAMRDYFPEEASFQSPTGGMFVWCELPSDINTTELLEQAIDEKVVYVPGQRFYPSEDVCNGMRLSFTMATAVQIEEGIKRLGGIFTQAVADARVMA